jgi:hypothetical protein
MRKLVSKNKRCAKGGVVQLVFCSPLLTCHVVDLAVLTCHVIDLALLTCHVIDLARLLVVHRRYEENGYSLDLAYITPRCVRSLCILVMRACENRHEREGMRG